MIDIPALKARLSDPTELARLLGLRVTQRLRNGVLCWCPVHNNKSGALRLRVSNGVFRMNCFGCGIYGDALDLLSAIEGDRQRGWERAAALAGGSACAPVASWQEPPRMDLGAYHELAERALRAGSLNGRAWVRPVEDYLLGRGLLGLARADGWAALPRFEALPGHPDELVAAKLARWDERGELRASWGAHQLVIPWRGPDGRICALQRRVIEKTDGPKYVLPWSPDWPYGADRLSQANVGRHRLCVVEGAVDTLAMRALHPSFAVLGVPGINGWRASWAELAHGREIRIALDRGKPGKDGAIPEDRAAARIALDCAGRRQDEPTSDRCSLRGGPEPWLCGACGRRRAPVGMDWGEVWRLRAAAMAGR